MKKIPVYCSLIFYLGFGYVFATEAPVNLALVESSDRSIVLDWDDVEGVEGYYIYYGSQTGVGGTYDVEGVDLIESSDTLLSSLIPDTEYFVAVTAIDEFGKESEFSNELQVRTRGEGSTPNSSFQALGVEVIDENTLEIEFNKSIDANNSTERTFIIEDKEMGTEIPVDISELDQDDPTRLFVLLGVDMLEDTDYKVTILDLQDSEGNAIEAGIDAFLTFSTPVSFSPLEAAPVVVSVEGGSDNNEAIVAVEDTDGTIGTEKDDVVTQNKNTSVSVSQDTVSVNTGISTIDTPNEGDSKKAQEDTQEIGSSVQESTISITPLNASAEDSVGKVAGKTLSEEEIGKGGVNQVAAESANLPTTGPAMWVLFLFIALFGGGMLYILNIKKAS